MIMISVWIAGISLLITFSIFLSHVIYRTGHIAARVEALERWRGSVRTDMHEISEKLEVISVEMRGLRTLIEERTDRRFFDRGSHQGT
jgi:hypothetical protein